VLQLDSHAAVLEQLESILCDSRSHQVAAETLEAIAVVGADRDGGVQIEAVEVGV
jgi:hypothetical protein